ncbi:MAG TPA: AraC family transcriptional regulator [Fibrobacteria bacterium]|nr:AraC family transcriptional regulator [Fibrobacteria bacterium]
MRPAVRVLVWSLPLAVALTAASLLHKKETNLLAAGPGLSHAFDDRALGGSSRIRMETDSGSWKVQLRLGTGFEWPYVGFGQKFLPGRLTETIDGSAYDSLVLVVSSRRQSSVRLNLKVIEPGLTDTSRDLSFLLLEQGLSVDPVAQRRSVALDGFTVPLWWEKQNGSVPHARPQWKRHLVGLEIINGMELPLGVDDTIEVRSIHMEGHRTWMWFAFPLLALAFSCLVDWRLRPPPSTASSVPPRTAPGASGQSEVPRAPVELPSHRDVERERLLAWMGANYARQDLSVDTASREVGIHSRRIPSIVREATGRTFPAQINELRLLEAARLLGETDRTFSEIAAAVGVANVPHLHRLFKARFGVTPGEWRAAPDLRPSTAHPQPDTTPP